MKWYVYLPLFILALTFVSAASLDFKSDTSNEYYTGTSWAPAVAVSYVHPLWTSNVFIPATWIWNSEGVTLDEASQGSNVTFRKTFTIPDCGNIRGSIQITTDNAYVLKLNNFLVGANDYWFDTETYDLTPYLQIGTNTLIVEATNEAVPGSAVHDNPAGLIYSGEATFCGSNGGPGPNPDPEVPEFGVIAGAVALVGALGIFLYRRK